MDSPASRVSVVIPCFNGARFLRETLESAANQTYSPCEIIVVDDGSTDESAEIAKSFGRPVRVISQANQGESVARNRGIDEARGDWVALLDADDLWEPDKIARQLEETISDDVICIYTDFYSIRDGEIKFVEMKESLDERRDYHIAMLLDWCVTPSTALVRTTVARNVRFPEWTRDSEDMIFFLQLRREGRFVRVREPLAGYRRTNVNQTCDPYHVLKSVTSRYEWFQRNLAIYDRVEQEDIVAGFMDIIAECHEIAYWTRNRDVVNALRALAKQIDKASKYIPDLMHKRLYPASAYRFKDTLDKIRHLVSRRA